MVCFFTSFLRTRSLQGALCSKLLITAVFFLCSLNSLFLYILLLFLPVQPHEYLTGNHDSFPIKFF